MKRDYRIDYINNIITVSKKFHEAASELGTTEFRTMAKLRKLGMEIVLQETDKRHPKATKSTLARLEAYISACRDAEKRLKKFKEIQKYATNINGQCDYDAVRRWFLKEYPCYCKNPEFDEDGFIILRTKEEMKQKMIEDEKAQYEKQVALAKESLRNNTKSKPFLDEENDDDVDDTVA